MQRYHDREWGVPLHNDRRLFELLVLEGAQAGLSWSTVLRKRAAYRQAFDGFDFVRVAGYGSRRIERLLRDPGLIRNRAKLQSAVNNARAVLNVRREWKTFDRFLWQFVGGHPVRKAVRSPSLLPARTEQSDAMSAALRDAGFSFVGSTICYAFMQATGMVNDHLVTCFRWREVARLD